MPLDPQVQQFLATVIPMMARDRRGPKLCCQILVTPMLGNKMNTLSYRDCGEGYFLTSTAMKWFWGHYLSRDEDASNPYAVPACTKNVVSLPPALVATVEYDPLRDEGNAYAERLASVGVFVIHRSYSGLIHGLFDLCATVATARTACQDVITITKQLLG